MLSCFRLADSISEIPSTTSSSFPASIQTLPAEYTAIAEVGYGAVVLSKNQDVDIQYWFPHAALDRTVENPTKLTGVEDRNVTGFS
jgi:hypothetical protein